MHWLGIKWSQRPWGPVWDLGAVEKRTCVFIPSLAQRWALRAALPTCKFHRRLRKGTACSASMVADWSAWLEVFWAVTVTGTVVVAMEEQSPCSNITNPLGRAWSARGYFRTPGSGQCFAWHCRGSDCGGFGEIWQSYGSCFTLPCLLEM